MESCFAAEAPLTELPWLGLLVSTDDSGEAQANSSRPFARVDASAPRSLVVCSRPDGRTGRPGRVIGVCLLVPGSADAFATAQLGRVALVGVGVAKQARGQPSIRLQKQASGRWSRDALIAA
jgi:hypothetical protein